MNAPTPTAGKGPVAKKTPKVQGPALDLSTLSVTDAPAPSRTGRDRRDNPFTDVLVASSNNRTAQPNGAWKGAGKAVTVPKANVTEVVNLIRYAANTLQMGSSVAYDTRDKAPAEPQSGWNYGVNDVPAGSVRIRFCSKSRKASRKGTDSTEA